MSVYLSNPSAMSFLGPLAAALRDCRSVLDVGCGNNSPMAYMDCPETLGLDGYAPSLEEARASGTHNEFLLGDVRRMESLLGGRRFDACVALDVIEHLPKEDGWRMLEQMEKVALQKVIIFTPNGFLPQRSRNGDLQEHLSGWTADEMRSKGYSVYGALGPKAYRGEYHAIVRRPRSFWAIASLVQQYTRTRNHPEESAAILCVKTLSR